MDHRQYGGALTAGLPNARLQVRKEEGHGVDASKLAPNRRVLMAG
jgi:hypothetical protein